MEQDQLEELPQIRKLTRIKTIAQTKPSALLLPNQLPSKHALSGHRILLLKTDPDSPELRDNILRSKLPKKEKKSLPTVGSTSPLNNPPLDVYYTPKSYSPTKKQFIIPNNRPLFKSGSIDNIRIDPHQFDSKISEIRSLISQMKEDEMNAINSNRDRKRIDGMLSDRHTDKFVELDQDVFGYNGELGKYNSMSPKKKLPKLSAIDRSGSNGEFSNLLLGESDRQRF